MNCGRCGQENRPGARFCDGCGQALSFRCALCDAELRPAARFCDSCGASVETDIPPPAELRPEARKIVTIVFADLIGSTPQQERMDAESVRHVMSRFYDAMREVLERHGGQIAKFIGDAVMAYFGAPEVREDDAERAVRAAFDMVAVLEPLNEEIERTWGVRIGMRTGVNTGEVVESSGGIVFGDPVNVAKRLEEAAADGVVLVGENTWRLVRDKVTLEWFGDLDLKGKAEPVASYRLVSLDPPVVGPRAPFVGRDAELAKLTNAFESAINDRSARLATVIGSAGVGKTRLAGELVSRAGASALVLEARCEPAGTSTFAPIADALRDAASIDEAAMDEDVVAALKALLPDGQPDRERIAARAATVLGAGEPGPPEETFWAVRRIFEALAREHPLVLVIDDVHWAEPMLLDLIEHLADWTRDVPMLLLALARPDLHESRPSLMEAGQRDALIVLLEGLDPGASVRLASDLLDADELPAALTERILASSEGNPLFLRELVRMLVDDGVLRKDEGSWVVTVDATDVDVPPTIHALLSARIDRLPADERVVVERSSVIGKQFYRGAVAALAPAPVAAALDQHLETLRRKQLVEPEGTYWIDEPVFRFHHVLIRDAAYRRLLKEARADLHERFAEWLERKAGELVGEHEEVIGYHLEQAHEYRRQLGPLDDRGIELGRRAAKHLAAAGRRAIDRDDLTAAAPLLGRALERLEEPDAEILIDRCEALLELGDIADGTIAIAQLARVADTARLQAWADCYAGQLANLVDPGRLHETAELVATAAARFAEIGDQAGAAKAHHVHAQTLGRLGQFGASEAALDRALAAARETGDNRRSNSVLSGIPVAVLWGPHAVAKATGRCLDVIRVLRITTASPAVESAALRCQAVLEALRGRADAARRMLETSRATLEELGLRHGLLETDMFAGIVEIYASEPVEAEKLLRRAYEGFRAIGVDVDAAYCAALLARALMSQGRNTEAEELTYESERLGGDDLKTGILWRAIRGAALAARGEVDEPLRLAREAVALAESTDASVDHADARRALGIALGQIGQEAAGRAEIARAIELYESKGATAAAEHARQRGTTIVRATSDTGRTGWTRAAPGVDGTLVPFFERLRVSIVEQDWNGNFASSFHADVVVFDERSGLRSTVVGRDAWKQGMAATYEGRSVDARWEIIARRNRALVNKMVVFGPGDANSGPWESDRLMVVYMGPKDDVIVRALFLDPDQLDTAISVFDEWAGPAVGGVGAEPHVGQRFIAAWTRFHDAVVAKEWDAAVATMHPEVAYADHRPGLRSEVTGDEDVIRTIRESYGTRDFDWDIQILDSRGDALILNSRLFGDGDDLGGPWETERLSVGVLDADDLITHMELFELSDREAAHARFDILAGPRRGSVRAAPGVDERVVPFWTRFRELMVARKWDEFGALWHPLGMYRDHRPGLQSEILGGEGAARIIEASFGQRNFDYDIEIVASRGRAVVFRSRFFGSEDEFGGPWEAERLVFGELDDNDLILRGELFDPAQRDVVLAMLDEVGPPPIEPVHARFWRGFGAALRDKDWQGFRDLCREDIVFADRRAGLRSELRGRDTYVRAMRESFGARALDYAATPLETSGDIGIARGVFSGPGDELGGSWESERLYAYVLDDFAIAHIELFDPADREAAFQLFGEWKHERDAIRAPADTDPRHPTWFRRTREAITLKRWDEWRRILSDDLIYIDHRAGLRSEITDPDEMVRVVRESQGTRDFDYRVEVLETYGDAGVVRVLWSGPGDDLGGPWETDRINFYVLAGDRLAHIELFDADDVTSPQELLREYAATHGSAHAGRGVDPRFTRFWQRCRAALVAHDWDAYGAMMHPNVLYTDRRPGLRSETSTRSEMVRIVRESFGVRDYDVEFEVLASSGDAAVLNVQIHGFEDELGGPFEADRLVFSVLDRDDLLLSYEMYEQSERDALLARLTRPERADGVRAAPDIDDRHVRRLDGLRTAIVAKDWGAAESLIHPEVVLTDIRSGLRAEYHGAQEYVRVLRESYGTRDFDWTVDIVAARGAACLFRSRWSGPGDDHGGPWETERLALCLFDDGGLLRRAEILDLDQLDEATVLLNEYARLVGSVTAAPGVAPNHIPIFERIRALAVAKAWDDLSSCFHPEIVDVDHRAGLRSELIGRDAMTRSISESYGIRTFDLEITLLETRSNAGVLRSRFFGPGDDEAGPWESERFCFYALDGESFSRFELYDLADRDAAFARLHETGDAGIRSAPGTDARHRLAWERFRPPILAKDWVAFGANLNDDIVHLDLRSGLRSEFRGRETYVRVMRESFGARAVDYSVEILATRGNAGVSRSKFMGTGDELGGPFEADRIAFFVLDSDDRFMRFELYDESALDEALSRLDEYERAERVRTPDGVDPRHPRWFQRFAEAVAARDWTAMGAQLTDDFVWNDIRRGIAARLDGRDESVRVIRESYGTRAPEYEVEILAVRGDVGVCRSRWWGRGDDLGGPWETQRLNVYILDGEAMRYIDILDLEELDDAYARLDAYAAHSPVRVISGRFMDAYNSRDWPALEQVISDDFILVDHRPLGWGTSTGYASFFERLQIGVDAAPDARVYVQSWRRETPTCGLFCMPMRGHVSEGGGDFELDRLVIAVTENDRLTRMELFDLDDEDAAAERFEQLRGG